MSDAADLARFLSKIEEDENGCWLWTGGRFAQGYGRFCADGTSYLAHRWAYEQFVGTIPEGLTVDHICHNGDDDCAGGPPCLHRRCVNPAHLEAVTNKVNILRGKAPTARRARSATCDKGHPLTGDNLYVRSDGHRMCRECNRASSRARAHSPKRLASNRRYRQSEKAKNARAEYRSREEVQERQRAASAKHYQAHKAEIAARRKARLLADPESQRAKQREYDRKYHERKRAGNVS